MEIYPASQSAGESACWPAEQSARQFTSLSAGLPAGQPAYESHTPPEAAVRMALIGAGSMGRQYAEMIDRGLVPHMRLTVVCCRSREACEWAGKNLEGDVNLYSSAEEVYRHPEEYDGVLIATPHTTHAGLACLAFALGKHVFCDKPTGVSAAEAKQMSQAAREHNRVFAVMFHQRLYAKNQRIYEILKSGQLGEIFRMSMKSTESYRTAAYHSSGGWRSSWAGEGGGALINQGQHLLDLWQWFFGMPKEICASVPFGKYNGFEVDDEAEILMKYEGKKTGRFFVSTGEAWPQERLEVVGSRGTLLMEGDRLTVCRYSQDSLEYGRTSSCRTGEQLTRTEETRTWPTKKNYEGMLENFARAILYGEPLIAPGEDGYQALALANGAYLSAWTGRWISIPYDESQYERELKKRIQAENHPACRVTTLCYLEKDGMYLMLHRVSKENDENKDKWIGVGGHVKRGESPEECLVREVREETGLTLISYRFRGLVTFVSDVWGTEYMCLYTADRWTGEERECDEGVLQWVEKEKVQTLPVWEGDKIFFGLLKDEAPFFSLKLRYEGDRLVEAVLDGKVLAREALDGKATNGETLDGKVLDGEAPDRDFL